MTYDGTCWCTLQDCNTMQYTALHCNTHGTCGCKLQYTATQCNTLQYTWNMWVLHCSTLQHTATHCNTLQHTATHCNTQTHKNTLYNGSGCINQHVRTHNSARSHNKHCNTLHHTASHCITLQHTGAVARVRVSIG